MVPSGLDKQISKGRLLKEWGSRGTVSVARIPAGTQVKYAIGTAREQISAATGEVRNGNGLQILFDEFDPSGVVQTRKMWIGYTKLDRIDKVM